MNNQSIYELIRGIKFFDSVPSEMLKELAELMQHVEIPSGNYLMKQGDSADCLFILTHGRMRVTVNNSDGEENKVGEIGVGDIVGEMALLTDLPRSASVRALRDCSLIKIDRKLFEKINKEQTQAAMGIVSECVKRLLPNFNEKKRGVKSISLISCSPSLDMESFSENFTAALSKYIKVKIITEKNSESLEPSKLAELENSFDMLIYVSNEGMTEFTKFAISQSDKILMVAEPHKKLDLKIAEYINQKDLFLAEKYLMLLHPSSTDFPQGTREILSSIPCDEHFHLKQKSDFERVARYLLGRSVSIVFSGGGLRGIAHQGLYTALYERGIPIDMAAGTSFGSIPAVLIGMGYTPDQMLDAWKSLVEKIKKVVDFTLPLAAISKGEVLYELLSETIPIHIDMEDLWIPTFAVSTNIANFSTHMHRTGPAWEAVRASLSIPGVFPPIVQGSNIFVDGASMNNLPVDLMSQINNQGTILASVASGKPTVREYSGYTEALSGWRMLPELISHTSQPLVPGIIDTLLASSLAACNAHEQAMLARADFAFDLGVDQFALLDSENWAQIRQKGYETAVKLIDEYELTPQKLGIY